VKIDPAHTSSMPEVSIGYF